MNNEKIFERIAIVSNGASQTNLAEICGVQQQTFSKWKKGNSSEIPLSALESIAKKYNCTVSYLIGESEQRTIVGAVIDILEMLRSKCGAEITCDLIKDKVWDSPVEVDKVRIETKLPIKREFMNIKVYIEQTNVLSQVGLPKDIFNIARKALQDEAEKPHLSELPYEESICAAALSSIEDEEG